MNILDIIILICFIPALVQGLRKGFIAQVIAIISIIAGIWLSFRFATYVSLWLAQYIQASDQILRITAFALILALTILGLGAVGKLMEATIKIVMLGWVNKLLGVLFSFIKCTLVVGLIILAFSSFNQAFNIVSEAELAKSVLYTPLKDFSASVFPYLKELLFLSK